MKTINVFYDGSFPNLCSGHLIVTIGTKKYDFGTHCLSSGGSCHIDADGNEEVTGGDWEIHTWPKGFPENMKEKVLDAVNMEINHGCCGGCI